MRANLTAVPHRVLIDTSGYFSLLVERDAHHQAMRDTWRLLSQHGCATFTTNFVIAEAHALFLTRLSPRRGAQFLRALAAAATTIVRVTPEDEQKARTLNFQYDEKAFSYTDATSFVVMERLHISAALTLDRNFAQYGFQMLGFSTLQQPP